MREWALVPNQPGIQAVPSTERLSGGDKTRPAAVVIRLALSMDRWIATVSVAPGRIREVPPWLNTPRGMTLETVAAKESRTAAVGPGLWISTAMERRRESSLPPRRVVPRGTNEQDRKALRSAWEAQPVRRAKARARKAMDGREVMVREGTETGYASTTRTP